MNIIIKDPNTNKEFMIKGHGLDFEIFQRSKGRKIDGEIKGEGEWISSRHYPSTLDSAVNKVIHWLLADPDDPDEIVTEAKDAGKVIRKAINKKVFEVKETIDD